MGFLSRFERKMEDTVEGAANNLSQSPISPVQISKRCEKQMLRNKMLGAGKQYVPTLFTVLVNPEDDKRLFSFYPTLAGETETFLGAKANEMGFYMDGTPLVRFIVDDNLKRGKFDVIAEVVSAGIISQLRQEEMERYGLAPQTNQAASNATMGGSMGGAGAIAGGAAMGGASGTGSANNIANGAAMGGAGNAAGSAAMGGASGIANSAANQVPAGYPAESPVNATVPHQQNAQQPVPYFYDTTNNQNYILNKNRMVAGRSTDCDIVIHDINASRHHALISQNGAGIWTIEDLGSKNGTLVNGTSINNTTPLYNGDVIVLGLTTYTFLLR